MSATANPLRSRGDLNIAVFNIAHRGARAFAPENTLVSFAKARHFGCPMFARLFSGFLIRCQGLLPPPGSRPM
jgi:hypothetical protein